MTLTSALRQRRTPRWSPGVPWFDGIFIPTDIPRDG
jgi:hypothetical protein